jgi:hypothetical protein
MMERIVGLGGGDVGRVSGVASQFFLAGSIPRYVALLA